MNMQTRTAPRLIGAAIAATMALAAPDFAQAQTKVKPGFNLFSEEQDVEIGRQASQDAERQFQILRDRNAETSVNQIVRSLAQHAPGARYPYQAKLVNANEINAFALPGGFLYLNSGTIRAAANEGELAGVIAHEMAHIALRHGTHQASKAYAAQAGLGVLGGLIGGGGRGANTQIVNAVGGLGLNAVFLKFSRDAETQADIVGAQMMAKAGYDPMQMVSFFETLSRQQKGGGVEFLSSHPAPQNRAARVRQEAQLIGAPARSRDTGAFAQMRGGLDTGGRAAAGRQTVRDYPQQTRRQQQRGRVQQVSIDQPSTRMREYQHRGGLFSIAHPQNWEVIEGGGDGITIAPRGGLVDDGSGQQGIVYGAIVSEYAAFDDQYQRNGRGGVRGATDDLVAHITQGNPHLRVARGSRQREQISGSRGESVVLQGRSPLTGQGERVTLYTRQLEEGRVVYALFVAPDRDYDSLDRTFTQMIGSLRIDDRGDRRSNDRDRRYGDDRDRRYEGDDRDRRYENDDDRRYENDDDRIYEERPDRNRRY